jgi:hypothetical protein
MKTRRILYTICFALLCVVDWVNGSQDGRLQFIATNLIGVLMGVVILSTYRFKEFLKPAYYVWAALSVIGAPIAILWAQSHYPYQGKFITAVINVCLYGFILIRTIEQKAVYKKTYNVRWPFLAVWLAMMIYMMFSPDRVMWPIWFAVMFGTFCLTEHDRDRFDHLLNGMTDGIVIGFVLMTLCTFLFRPYDEARYHGAYANSNINALFYLMVYCALLGKQMLLKKAQKPVAIRVLYLLFAGAMFGFVSYTGCRSALLAMFAVSVVYLICAVAGRRFPVVEPEDADTKQIDMKDADAKQIDLKGTRKKEPALLLQIALLVLSAIISVPLLYLPIRYAPTVLHRPFFWYAEYNEDKVFSYDPWNSEKYVSFEEMLAENFGRIFSFLPAVRDAVNASDEANKEPEVNNHPEDVGRYILQTDEKLSTVKQRGYIYAYYAKNLRLYGHSVNEDGVPLSPRYHEDHAHDFLLQMSFWYGIPVGIGFLFLFVLCLIRFIDLLKKKSPAYACVFGCFVAAFIVFGLSECVWGVGQLPFVLFFFLLYFVMKKDVSEA